MKKIFYPIVLIVLMSGCAKVSQEGIPCGSYVPPSLSLSNQIVQIGDYAQLSATLVQNATVRWTGPHNFVSTLNPASVYIADSSYFGRYTATQYINGCPSALDTFDIYPNQAAAPPCTIAASSYNVFHTADGVTFAFPSAGNLLTQLCSNSVYDVNGYGSQGYTFDFYTIDPPVPGAAYDLTSSCSNLTTTTQGSITLNTNGALYYYSISGKAYCNVINGKTYITLCSATFLNAYNNANTTVSGNIQYQ